MRASAADLFATPSPVMPDTYATAVAIMQLATNPLSLEPCTPLRRFSSSLPPSPTLLHAAATPAQVCVVDRCCSPS